MGNTVSSDYSASTAADFDEGSQAPVQASQPAPYREAAQVPREYGPKEYGPGAKGFSEQGPGDALAPWTRGIGEALRAPVPGGADARAAADRVMRTGERFGPDDYDARLVSLANELANGPGRDVGSDPTKGAAYRRELMAEIFRRDPVAMGSWLTPERANGLMASGGLSADGRASIAEGLATAFNRGSIPASEILISPTPGAQARVKFNPLDNVISGADFGDRAERAQQMRGFIELFGSSSGPEVTRFRRQYAQHLLDEYFSDAEVGRVAPMQREAAVAVALNLISGDAAHPEMAANVLSKYDGRQIRSLMEEAAHADGRYGEDSLRVPAMHRWQNAGQISMPDTGAQLMRAIQRDSRPEADRIAVDLSRLAASSPDIFRGEWGRDRLNALTDVVTAHDDAVLGALTTDDNSYIGDESTPTLQQYMQNASDLGALFKMTLFNPTSANSRQLQASVVSYANALASAIDRPGPNGDEVGHMAMLQAGLTDSVRQGFEQLAKDQGKSREALGFVLDLVVSTVPFGKMTKGGLEKALTEAFGHSPRLREALQAPLDKLIDQSTGKLTEEGKKALLDRLDKPHRTLEIARLAANRLNETLTSQVSPNDYDRKQIDTEYKTILNGINSIRGQ